MADLTTRTVRRRLPGRHEPHWVRIARGRALGYRRTAKEAGTWYVRVYAGQASSFPYHWRALGTADDFPNVQADGAATLNYAQAVEAASAWDPHADPEAPAELQTVGDVVREYLAWADDHRPRSAKMARYQAAAHILPALGEVRVETLTSERLRRWQMALAKAPARTRSPKGKQRYRETNSDEAKRSRRATANRVASILKAALNRAWREGRIAGSDQVWRRVEPFKGVERSRARVLESDDIRRLLNAADEPRFRALLAAAVYTGCRYSELARLRVADVRIDAGAVVVRFSKTNTTRNVFLNDEGRALFESLTAGKAPDKLVFMRDDASAWGPSDQQERMRRVCEAASIDPPITFHGLRHTYATLYLMAGGGLPDLAKQLGHSTTRMVERHYGHLADAWRAERARQFAPALGGKAAKVRGLRRPA